jgi:integrase
LAQLRHYWRALHPVDWLFPSKDPGRPLTIGAAQRVFVAAKRRAGIDKVGGIHSLRHAYATHQLAAGVPVQQLQYQLGHSHLESTLRYVHWLPGYQDDQHASVDLLAGLEMDHD